MNYYNPYYDELKDERLEIIEEKLSNNTKFICAYLHPKDNYICPICSSKKSYLSGREKELLSAIYLLIIKVIFY